MPWDWWDALVVFLVFFAVRVEVVRGLSLLGSDWDENVFVGVAIVASSVLLVLMTMGWAALRGRPTSLASERPPALRDVGGMRMLFGPKRTGWRDLAWGGVHGLIALVAVNIVLAQLLEALARSLERELPQVQERVRDAVGNTDAFPWIVLAVVVITPLGEELLYRGMFFQGLHRRLPAWPAIGLSGLGFGLVHFEPLVILLTFPLGMYFAWIFRRRGTLWTPIVAHAVFNLTGVLLILVSPAA